MRTLDYLGLDENKVSKVAEGLAQLLADFQVYYSNLRGFHWNVKGKGFFVMHAKYEEMYNDAAEKVDEIAERILQLGAVPESKFSEYLKISQIKEAELVTSGCEARELLFGWLKALIAQERALLALASDANDEVTVSLMSDYLKGQEKLLWMLVAFSTRHDKGECSCSDK